MCVKVFACVKVCVCVCAVDVATGLLVPAFPRVCV